MEQTDQTSRPALSAEDCFRFENRPWIFFWLGVAVTAACMLIRFLFTPGQLPAALILALILIALLLGFLLGRYTRKKVKKNRDFFDMFRSMRTCWIIGLVLLLLSLTGGWPYAVSLMIPPLCIPYFAQVLPAYGRRKADLYVSTHTTRQTQG